MHRRASTATTDISSRHQEYHPHPHHHQPVFIPGSLHPQDSDHQNLAMSAPANMGFEYGGGGGGYPTQNHIPNGVSLENGSTSSTTNSTNNMARSFEDDYTAQMKYMIIIYIKMRKYKITLFFLCIVCN